MLPPPTSRPGIASPCISACAPCRTTFVASSGPNTSLTATSLRSRRCPTIASPSRIPWISPGRTARRLPPTKPKRPPDDMKHYSLMVPGATPSAKRAEVRSPNDMQVFATADTGGAEVVEKALSTAYALFRDRDKWIPVPKRIEVLHKAAEIMQGRFEELSLLIAKEGGKPLIDA